MSLSKILQTPKIKVIDGVDIEFPRVDIYDIGKIDEARKESVKAIALRCGKEQDLTNADLYNICMDIAARDFTIGEMLNYATTPKGSSAVLERSLVKSGKKLDDAKRLLEQMKPIEILNLAQELIIQPDKEDVVVEKKVDTQEKVSEPETLTSSQSGKKTVKKSEPLGFGD